MRTSFLHFLRESESSRGRMGATLDTGAGVSSFADLAEAGYANPPSPQRNARFDATYREALKLYNRVLAGDRFASFQFQEAMTMSDFGTYFGTILDRSVLAAYAETPYSWASYAKRARIRDFRQAQIFRGDRGASVLNGPILPNDYGASGSGLTGLEQITEYPQRKRQVTAYTDQIRKFGAAMNYSWETMINDDLDLLRDTPALFGRAARRTEEKKTTQLYATSAGPNSTFFSTANANLVTNSASQFPFVTTNNPPLSVTSLAWALQIAAMQLDLDGEPISIEGWMLVVPPALDITARNIVNAVQIWMNDQGGTADSSDGSLQRLITKNWAAGRVTPALNYYLPIVDTTYGNTAWYLFALPSAGRPAMQLSFLQGHEMPELFMKASNAIPIGEGQMAPGGGAMPGASMLNPFDGDFDQDAIMYKIRHCLGGTLLDSKCAVASNGSGS